jgi:hypothetical protein
MQGVGIVAPKVGDLWGLDAGAQVEVIAAEDGADGGDAGYRRGPDGRQEPDRDPVRADEEATSGFREVRRGPLELRPARHASGQTTREEL